MIQAGRACRPPEESESSRSDACLLVASQPEGLRARLHEDACQEDPFVCLQPLLAANNARADRTNVCRPWQNSDPEQAEASRHQKFRRRSILVGGPVARGCREIIIGGAGDSAIIPQVYNYTAGTKFKLVTGYPGTANLVLAMERGEIQGIGYYPLCNILERNHDWLKEGKTRVLLQTGSKRNPQLPDVPLVSELALDGLRLQIQNLWLAPLDVAGPFAMPPKVPKERVTAVRSAFDRMEFQADAHTSGMVLDPRSAEDIRALLAMVAGTSPAIIEEARRAVQGE